MWLRLRLTSEAAWIREDCRREFALSSGQKIGKWPGCEIQISGVGVARIHTAVIEIEGKYFLEDMNTGGGMLVNGQRCQGRTEFKAGDTIRLGSAEFQVESSTANFVIEDHRGIAYVALRPGLFDSLTAAEEEDRQTRDLIAELQQAWPASPAIAVLHIAAAGAINSRTVSIVWSLLNEMTSSGNQIAVAGAPRFIDFWKIYPDAPRGFEDLLMAEAYLRGGPSIPKDEFASEVVSKQQPASFLQRMKGAIQGGPLSMFGARRDRPK